MKIMEHGTYRILITLSIEKLFVLEFGQFSPKNDLRILWDRLRKLKIQIHPSTFNRHIG